MSKSNKTYDERLAAERERIEQARNRIKALEQRQKAEERKARTKRLISIGAEVEHYAGCQIDDLESFKAYLSKYAYAIANSQKSSSASNEVNTEFVKESDSELDFDSSEFSSIS